MLAQKELINVKGGAINWITIGIGLGAVATFLIGVIDGYLRPLSCND